MCYRLTLNRSQIIFFDFFSKSHFSDTDHFSLFFFDFFDIPFIVSVFCYLLFQFIFFVVVWHSKSVRLGLWLSVEFVGSTFRFSLAWLLMTN